MMTKNKDVKSLYIHIPFCDHICDYCDFPKLQYFRTFAEKYISALKKEIESYHINPKSLETIYIGGGTPTSLDDDLFEELLRFVSSYIKNVKEYTIEANPESLTLNKLQLMKKCGVNRISIGVESTDDKILELINRHHTFKDVQTAVSNAYKEGFDNLNVDLIIGLPQVNKERLKKDLDNILSLGVSHISCYSLTVHPNTMFYIKGINPPEDDFARELYDIVEAKLHEAGYVHYEISNWAKPKRESIHNFTYWKDEQYYGVGLGASGFIGDARYTNTRNLDKYLNGEYVESKEVVEPEDDKTYFVMLNLRTNRGISLDEYRNRFGEDFLDKYEPKIKDFINSGLLTFNKETNSIIPTYDGMMILDKMIMELTD